MFRCSVRPLPKEARNNTVTRSEPSLHNANVSVQCYYNFIENRLFIIAAFIWFCVSQLAKIVILFLLRHTSKVHVSWKIASSVAITTGDSHRILLNFCLLSFFISVFFQAIFIYFVVMFVRCLKLSSLCFGALCAVFSEWRGPFSVNGGPHHINPRSKWCYHWDWCMWICWITPVWAQHEFFASSVN